IDLSRTLGWFTSMYPVRLSHGDASLSESIQATKAQLRAVPNKGIGYGVLRYLHRDASVRAALAGSVPRVTFNYLGQLDQVLKSNEAEVGFVPAEEDSGAEHHEAGPLANWLEVIGEVSDHCLSVGFTFSREAYREVTIDRLRSSFEQELTAVILHCVALRQQREPARSPSVESN
ncbi:MAG: condensation domain-containing protein, partial [Polyangiaceae bacterium]